MFLTDLRRKRLRRAARHSAPTSTQDSPEGHSRTRTAGDSHAGPNPTRLNAEDAIQLFVRFHACRPFEPLSTPFPVRPTVYREPWLSASQRCSGPASGSSELAVLSGTGGRLANHHGVLLLENLVQNAGNQQRDAHGFTLRTYVQRSRPFGDEA